MVEYTIEILLRHCETILHYRCIQLNFHIGDFFFTCKIVLEIKKLFVLQYISQRVT